MQINILAVYCALGAALQLAMSIHGISAYDYSEQIDYFQIDADQEVELLHVYILVDTTTSLVYHSFLLVLHTPHAHLFFFPL
jgi:hypothetical protein